MIQDLYGVFSCNPSIRMQVWHPVQFHSHSVVQTCRQTSSCHAICVYVCKDTHTLDGPIPAAGAKIAAALVISKHSPSSTA